MSAGSFIGYGAVVPDGYGVCYRIYKDRIDFNVASYFGDNDTR